jgi:hypothetical protein
MLDSLDPRTNPVIIARNRQTSYRWKASTDTVNKGELVCWWFVAWGGFSLQSPYIYLFAASGPFLLSIPQSGRTG